MKVFILRADMGGSGYYRMSEPARAVRDAYDVEITDTIDLDVRGRTQWDGSVRIDSVDLGDADVLVLQRPLTQRHYAVAERARAQGTAIVVELDDDFHNVHRDNAAYDAMDPARDPWNNKNWLMRTLEHAHLLTCSTPALLKYTNVAGRTIPGRVVRNRLPAEALRVTPADPWPHAVGWTGTTAVHPADLQRGRGALDLVDFPVHVVGDEKGVAAALGVDPDRVKLAQPWTTDHSEYRSAIRDNIGIGIAPLEPSKFNRAKSWLKPLEYATFGIPFVVSPLPEYRHLVKLTGAGILAHSDRTWSQAVHRLATDESLRAEHSERGRTWAEANVLERHASEWYDAWVTASEIAK